METESIDLKSLAFDRSPQAVLVVGVCGRVILRNAAARRMLPAGEEIGQAVSPGAGPDTFEWRRQFEIVLEAGQPRVRRDLWVYREGGGQVLVDLHISRLDVSDARCDRRRNDARSDCGACVCFLVSIEDVAERASMERRLTVSHRLAAIGKLSAEVAHQLNTPLDATLRYLGLARRCGADQADEYLDKARRGLMRMTRIIGDLAQHGRIGDHDRSEDSLRSLLDEVLAIVQPAAGSRGIEFAFDLAPIGPCRIDGNLFHVFCNIIRNALDAMDQGGRLTVRFRRRGQTVAVEFQDTGPGLGDVDPAVLFKPFYTSKEGQGSGLGLAIAADLVERMGGTLQARNAEAGGALFIVELPYRPLQSLGQDDQNELRHDRS
jgi:signal transduction histidine kinase